MLTQEQQIFEQIKKANNILITFTKNWNGDAVASALALRLFLKKLGKDSDIVAQDPEQNNPILQNPKKTFSFLLGFSEIKNSLDNLRKFVISLDITNAKVSQIKYKMEESALNFIVSPKDGFFTQDDITSSSSGFKYDLIITLDTTDLEALGKIYDNDTEFFYKTSIINIDHHSENEEFGQINFIELNAVSTTEILFSLFDSYSRELIDEDIATCLLAGIIFKTKSFKTSNITPQTLLTTSQLISMGARREEIVNRLYRSRDINILKLWGRVLARLSGDLDNKLVWSVLPIADFLKTGSDEKDLNDVIEELVINIPQAKIILLIYETKNVKENNNITNVIAYSVKNIDSMNLLKEFSPQGTKRMAYTTLRKDIATTEKEVVESVKNKMRKLPL